MRASSSKETCNASGMRSRWGRVLLASNKRSLPATYGCNLLVFQDAVHSTKTGHRFLHNFALCGRIRRAAQDVFSFIPRAEFRPRANPLASLVRRLGPEALEHSNNMGVRHGAGLVTLE